MNLKFFSKAADIYREYLWARRGGHLIDEKFINPLMRLERTQLQRLTHLEVGNEQKEALPQPGQYGADHYRGRCFFV
ncbi:MAG: hypothetical protein PVH01_08845, partial [Desulfobacterales bacterium]